MAGLTIDLVNSPRPLIAITTTTGFEAGALIPNYPRTNVASDYVDLVLAAGGTPVLLPIFDPTGHEQVIAEQLAGVDAVIFTGGQDIDPARYGADPAPELGATSTLRDEWDFTALALAREVGLPVLGICRGSQLINVALGGTLVQDLPTGRPSEVAHWQPLPNDRPSHAVQVAHDGLLAQLGRDEFAVTSFHHQGVDRLGEGLRLEATAPDGLVEAFSAEDGPWLLGVQWHPEMSFRNDPPALELAGLLIEQAR